MPSILNRPTFQKMKRESELEGRLKREREAA